jgi:hypothetical protein
MSIDHADVLRHQARDGNVFDRNNDTVVVTRSLLTGAADELDRMLAENRRLHDTRRWNIKVDGSDLLICTGAHEKYEGCEFYRYRIVPAQ